MNTHQQELNPVYDVTRAQDFDDDLGASIGTGEAMGGLLRDAVGELLPDSERTTFPPVGPVLALFSGRASAEKQVMNVLPTDQQTMTAVDYNPNLVSNDPRVSYELGDVLQVLPNLADNQYGVVTVFNADGSINRGSRDNNWPVLWEHIERVLKPNGYVLISSSAELSVPPATFAIVKKTKFQLIAVKL